MAHALVPDVRDKVSVPGSIVYPRLTKGCVLKIRIVFSRPHNAMHCALDDKPHQSDVSTAQVHAHIRQVALERLVDPGHPDGNVVVKSDCRVVTLEMTD